MEQSLLNDRISDLVAKVNLGDAEAKNEILSCTADRLLSLTRNMKKGYGSVSRWEQTEDVFQNAMIRLNRALESLELNDLRHFLRLAALQIRRELVDLSRHHKSKNRLHQTRSENGEQSQNDSINHQAVETTGDPNKLEDWEAFHKAIETLDEKEREVVELLWYHGFNQTSAAGVMDLSIKQVRTLWRKARLNLFEQLGGSFPEIAES